MVQYAISKAAPKQIQTEANYYSESYQKHTKTDPTLYSEADIIYKSNHKMRSNILQSQLLL